MRISESKKKTYVVFPLPLGPSSATSDPGSALPDVVSRIVLCGAAILARTLLHLTASAARAFTWSNTRICPSSWWPSPSLSMLFDTPLSTSKTPAALAGAIISTLVRSFSLETTTILHLTLSNSLNRVGQRRREFAFVFPPPVFFSSLLVRPRHEMRYPNCGVLKIQHEK